jgi:predicted N-acetyltransferase YhbS
MEKAEIIIRQEEEKDRQEVIGLTSAAFSTMEFSTGDEAGLVQRLRESSGFIPELSIVAVYKGTIIGHILFTKISIVGEMEYETLSLAPMSVHPDYQRRGVGKLLIREGLSKAKQLGYKSVIVVGHHEYYPKFGFIPASKFGLKPTFNVPDEVFMAQELMPESLKNKEGYVHFPPEFNI